VMDQGLPSGHHSRRRDMTDVPVDILLVEEDPNDGEMAVRAIRRHNVTRHIYRSQAPKG